MVDDAALPRGAYRAVLVDKGGARVERSLAFDDASVTAHGFPVLRIDGGRVSVQSDYAEHQLLAYDEKGATVKKVRLDSTQALVAELKLPPAARSVALWAEDPVTGIAAFTDSVPLQEP